MANNYYTVTNKEKKTVYTEETFVKGDLAFTVKRKYRSIVLIVMSEDDLDEVRNKLSENWWDSDNSLEHNIFEDEVVDLIDDYATDFTNLNGLTEDEALAIWDNGAEDEGYALTHYLLVINGPMSVEKKGQY